MPNSLDNQELRPFLSIRWKLFGVLACLLTAIYIIFVLSLFRFQQDAHSHNTYHNVIQSKKALNQGLNATNQAIHSVLNTIIMDAKKTHTGLIETVVKTVTKSMPTLFSINEIEGITLMNADYSIRQEWGEGVGHTSFSSKKEVTNGFICEPECFVYVALPIKNNNKTIAILIAYKKIDKLLNDYLAMTGTAVNLVNDTPNITSEFKWSKQLKVQSQVDFSVPILNQLVIKQKKLLEDKEYSVRVFGINYSVVFSSFNSNNDEIQQSYQWVFIKNSDIENSWLKPLQSNVMFWILISFLVSLLLLYLIVDRFSGQLPRILAMSKAINLDSNLYYRQPMHNEKKILDDELQQYDRHLAKISNKLDVLREAESNNAIKLQTMVRELNQTKSFIDRLLNDQQTVIMVQRLGGEIIALNKAGSELFEVEDFSGLTYSELLCADISTDDGLAALNYLYLGGETLVKAEAQWTDKKNNVYTLLWVHTLLSVPGTIDPIILSVCVDITAQRKAEDRLEWLAFNDPSLINYNKQVFLEYLPFAITRSLERQKILALLYCEVSGLPEKSGMDNSEIRDKIIKDVGVRMSKNLRQYDMFTQLSEDHFVIILEGLNDIGEAEEAVKNVIATYTESIEVGRKEYALKVVIGASYAPKHTESVPELLRNAELAQYQAKIQGDDFFSAVVDN